MKNIPKEIKVAVIAIISILVFIWLFNFLKGNNLLRSTDRYYALFNNIGGLEESSPVEINGYKTGIVRNIRFINDGSGRLLVSMGINKGYKLPLGTVAQARPETMLGGMKIELKITGRKTFHNKGDTLVSSLDRGIVNELSNEFSPLAEKTGEMISGIDSLLVSMNRIFTDEFNSNIRKSSVNLENVSRRLNKLIEGSDQDISQLISKLDNFSTMLENNTTAIDTTIERVSAIAGSLSEAELKESVNNFNTAVKETTILLEKINNGHGSAGLLLNDDSLYTELSLSLEQLNLLLEDIKSNPGRYVNFSIFGRKNN